MNLGNVMGAAMGGTSLLGTAAMLGGSYLSYKGQKGTNDMNLAIARETNKNQYNIFKEGNQFNADQAGINRDFQSQQASKMMSFQERMSSTAYQRSMADMKKAGLNPVLAHAKGGASSPAGASGGGASASAGSAPQQKATMQNALGEAVSTALQMSKMNAEIENITANTKKTRAEKQNIETKLPGRKSGEIIDNWKLDVLETIDKKLRDMLQSTAKGGLPIKQKLREKFGDPKNRAKGATGKPGTQIKGY